MSTVKRANPTRPVVAQCAESDGPLARRLGQRSIDVGQFPAFAVGELVESVGPPLVRDHRTTLRAGNPRKVLAAVDERHLRIDLDVNLVRARKERLRCLLGPPKGFLVRPKLWMARVDTKNGVGHA